MNKVNTQEYIIQNVFKLPNFRANPKLCRNKAKELNLSKNAPYSSFVVKIDSNSIKIDSSFLKINGLATTTFKELLPLYHEHYYKYNHAFNAIKNIKMIVFQTYTRENSYYHFLVFNKRDYKLLKNNILNIYSMKYKAQTTRKERSIIYKMKHNTTAEYKDIHDHRNDLKTIKEKIAINQEDIKYLQETIADLNKILNDLKQEKEEKEAIIDNIQNSNSIYEKPTTIEDYY